MRLMVDIENMDKSLQEIVRLKNLLATMGYDNKDYDIVEEELHDKEDNFVEVFGEYLEDVLHNVHDEYCPDNDVLLPIAYLAKKYIVTPENEFDVPTSAGVFVDADDYPGKNTRLVLIPNPTRLVLNIDAENRTEVWSSVKDK